MPMRLQFSSSTAHWPKWSLNSPTLLHSTLAKVVPGCPNLALPQHTGQSGPWVAQLSLMVRRVDLNISLGEGLGLDS